ncbi:MAG: beta-lactamase family protein [Aureispira sp.]|nr:beta-lactamase family protein [Aureispira sp.]
MKYLYFIFLYGLPFNLLAQENIEESLKEIISSVSSSDQPGLSIGLVQKGKLTHHLQGGLANLEYDVSIHKNTVFGLASITKQFTAGCIGVLVQDKKIDLEEDVRTYIPELPNFGDTIRIQHLLNHTSGLRNHNVLLDLKGFDYNYNGYNNAQIQALIFKQKGVNTRPGERMLYANSNYVLLALIVERVSGMSLDKFAQVSIFQPLKMERTFFLSDNRTIVKDRAQTYYTKKGKIKQHKSLTTCIGAGGLMSTVEDLALWSNMFTIKGHPFSWLASFITKEHQLKDGRPLSYAQGVFIDTYSDVKTIHHSGRGRGMRAQIISIPTQKITIIVLTNTARIDAVDISYQVLDLLLPKKTSVSKQAKKYQHTEEALKHFVGEYQEMNSDLAMSIFIKDDTLKAKSSFGRNAVNLAGLEKGRFQRVGNATVVHQFFDKKVQDWDMSVSFGGATFYFEKVVYVDAKEVLAKKYRGIYFSEELDIEYELFDKNDKLYLSYLNNPSVELFSGQKDEFGSGRRTRYVFDRNGAGEITSFRVASEGTVKDILFVKK